MAQVSPIYQNSGADLGKELYDEGLLPVECVNVELGVPVDGLIQVKFTCNLTGENLVKFARAMARYTVKYAGVDAVETTKRIGEACREGVMAL